MPRINVEDKWFDDPRRTALIEKIGQLETDGAALQIWRLAQTYYRLETLIPTEIFMACKHATEFIRVGLAQDCMEDGIYIKGSKECFDWIGLKKEAGRRGGLICGDGKQQAAILREKKRRGEHASEIQQPQATTSNQKQPQASFSSSSSNNKNIKKPSFDFETPYKLYPCKKGKTRGIAICHAQIKTPEDFVSLCDAIRKYAAHHKQPLPESGWREDPMHFSTFMGCWREFLEPDWGDTSGANAESLWVVQSV